MRRVLAETGLEPELLAAGHKLAETMVELFSGLPPGHEFFERFSFIRHEELPEYKALLARVAESGLASLDEAERERLLALPFRLVPARHRLGLVDEALEARILRARRYFREHLPSELAGAVEFFDPARYNGAASIQDNILFGKVVSRSGRRGDARRRAAARGARRARAAAGGRARRARFPRRSGGRAGFRRPSARSSPSAACSSSGPRSRSSMARSATSIRPRRTACSRTSSSIARAAASCGCSRGMTLRRASTACW
ncbi:MAG: hypothetical protein RML56_14935 [Burkholderiales bacterium]|nr:hypothetical protein [Burkholderiales bacterium]